MPASVIFDPARLRQARHLAMLTKREVAHASGVSPAAVGQYEAAVSIPRHETITRLAKALDVPEEFFAAGRPHQRLETNETHFESLRATTVKQQQHATAFAEQIWELSNALEGHVRFPEPDLDLAVPPDVERQAKRPARAALAAAAANRVRQQWGLGDKPVAHLIAHLESRGILCALAPPTDQAIARIDAYSTRSFGRPLMVLTPDRANDVLRHRFSAAHELGHLILHAGTPSGEAALEREADTFAAELLTPRHVMADVLPSRLNFAALYGLSEQWGVAVKSLVYRSAELGLFSESTARRAYIRLAENPQTARPIQTFDGEVPSMLKGAFDLAATRGVTIGSLARELGWKTSRVRLLLGHDDPRPELRIITSP